MLSLAALAFVVGVAHIVLQVTRGEGLKPYPVTRARTLTFPIVTVVPAVVILVAFIGVGSVYAVRFFRGEDTNG